MTDLSQQRVAVDLGVTPAEAAAEVRRRRHEAHAAFDAVRASAAQARASRRDPGPGRECPVGCGACCDPVTLPYTKLDAQLRPEHFTERDRRFLLEDLTPISRREGLARAPWLDQGGRTYFAHDGRQYVAWTYFYECRWLDPETRLCRNYDDRPDVCREFPWYGQAPDPTKNIPTCCVYREDVGQPVEPVPVAIGRRP